ncbi:hypothetical protein TWF481_002669 [Arthrobotrys musiformis]|uniref:Uncharacterized protein n=1 Tax=Arthrobotrys musiformis TaxID=47236 RepID=A0AAV9VTC6_9PEZI
MARKRPHTQAEYEAFREEFKDFFPSRLSSADIRKILGIPGRVIAGGLKNIDNNIEWNEIRSDVRKILKDRKLDDLDEQIDIANEMENLKSLRRHTAEPRKFFEWFRYNHGRNIQKVKVEKKKRVPRTEASVDADESECEKAGSENAVTADEKEPVQPSLIMSLQNVINPTD